MGKRIIHKSDERIDAGTGEIVRSSYAIIVDKKHSDNDFVKVFKCFTQKVLDDLEIESGKAKLLFWFIDQVQDLKVNQMPIIVASVNKISKDLGCANISVYKWLSLLIEKGYISKFKESDGKILQNTYRINPAFIIKGKLSEMEQEE